MTTPHPFTLFLSTVLGREGNSHNEHIVIVIINLAATMFNV
jgi:hypothetical protein